MRKTGRVFARAKSIPRSASHSLEDQWSFFVSKCVPSPNGRANVLAALAAIIPDARATQGVVSLDIARDLLDPDSFVATGI